MFYTFELCLNTGELAKFLNKANEEKYEIVAMSERYLNTDVLYTVIYKCT